MILITAWKNVWRNKLRSLVVIVAVTIGVFAGIFAVALMNGTMLQRIDAALNEEISHIQINQNEFRDNFDLDLLLPNSDSINRTINRIPGVEAVANRVILTGMATKASKSAAVQITGVNFKEETAVFNLDERLIPGTGSYFSEESRPNMVFLGQDLAKELNIIRYKIEQPTLDTLRRLKVPVEVLNKLSDYIGTNFSSQKAFATEMESVLSRKETKRYGQDIQAAAWSYSDRSRVSLSFLDKNKNQSQAVFRIAGIYDIKNSMFEKSQVFVQNKDLQRLTGLGRADYHMKIVRISDVDDTKNITNTLRGELDQLQVQSWKNIQPDLAMMSMLVEKFHAVFMLIILAALAFGIINTMLMAVLERTKELGMLTAIGMNKKKVFSMIMLESVFLSMVGGLIGMLISKIIVSVTAIRGINFAGAAEGFEAMGFSAHIYPSASNFFFITVTILIILTGIISAIYPAMKALKLDPAEALRTE